METIAAQSLVLEAGKSAELRAQFLGLAEMRTAAGEPWHLPGVLRKVGQLLACRAYGPVLHQLCHLVPVAEAAGGRDGYLGFFWNEASARRGGCRALLGGLPGHVGSLSGDRLTVRLPDRSYELGLGVIPRLVCLMHFLLSGPGYGAVSRALKPLCGAAVGAADISKAAGELSKILYDYLADHLPTVQAQRRSQAVLAMMADRAGPGFGPEAIDDGAVLDLWDLLIDGGGDLGRSFEAAWMAALDLRRLLARGAELKAFDRQAPIGSDREAGEVDPDALLAACETLDEESSPLDGLSAAPADLVKALNKRETARLKDMVAAGDEAGPLALSLLRLAVFRPAHLRLSQGLRRKLPPGGMARLVEGAVETDHAGEIAELGALASHLVSMRLAGVAVLAQAGHDAAFTAASHLISEDEGKRMQRIIPDRPDLMQALTESGFLKRAAAALKSVNRQGFRPADLEDAAVIDGHAAAAGPLHLVDARLARFLDALGKLGAGHPWDARFAGDLDHFTARFRRLFVEDAR
ncbi:MAG: hypothetical protein RJQ21_19100 [Rhodospirillales bacterium]